MRLILRKLLIPLAIVAVGAFGSGCTLFTTALYGNQYGIANEDGFVIKYTLNDGFSQLLSNVYFNCGQNINCLINIAVPNIQDTVGKEALTDCAPEGAGIVCPYNGHDLQQAIVGRTLTNPGGFPGTDWQYRCLAFNVYPYPTSFVPNSWSWLRPGNWSC